jgi:hypothetical protein
MNLSPTPAPAAISFRLRALRAALVCGLGAWLALGAAPASAKIIHESEGSFNGADAPGGPLPHSFAAAADRSAGPSRGDVYVGSLNSSFEGSVYKFSATGGYSGEHLTGTNTPAGSFSLLSFSNFHLGGLAVDGTAGANAGDLYVADTGHGVVDRFSESGTFQCQITAGTPATSEEEEHECNGAAGSKPTSGPEAIEPAGLAVDSSGDVYVADAAHQVIDEFAPSGAYIAQVADSTITSAGPIAVDPSGNLYVANSSLFGGSTVARCSSPPTPSCSVLDANGAMGVAVDPATGHVYVAESSPERQIAEYDSAGNLIDVFAVGQVGISPGLAVGPNGDVYATNLYEGPVDIFGPDLVVPEVSTGAATDVGEATATLHGEAAPDTVHSGGEVTACRFEYGDTTAYGRTAPCSPAAPYAGPQAVSAELSGLRKSTEYHFRLTAEDAEGAGHGEDQTFTTPGPPTVDMERAEAEEANANLRAEIDPWGHDTTCQVQYVEDTVFQASNWANAKTLPCSPEDLGEAFGDQTAKVRLTGLAAATTYHYRFLATNEAGLSGFPDRTFSTFGIESFTVEDLNEAGEPETQAGAHPYEFRTTIALQKTTITKYRWDTNNGPPHWVESEEESAGANTKDLDTQLAPGLIGNPTAIPTCARYLEVQDHCPGETQVGIMKLWTSFGFYEVPIHNLVPSGQSPAEFGAFIEGYVGAWIPFHVRTGGDYGITADSINVTANADLEKFSIAVWGVPADPSHESQRFCVGPYNYERPCPDAEPQKPLLRNPTSCAGPQTVTQLADTWQDPGNFVKKTAELPAFTGCNALQFEPSLEAVPTTNVADSPSGLHVDLHVPQPEACDSGPPVSCETAEADLKDARVVLPKGIAVNPASANGLSACSSVQIELHGPNPPSCPDASKIGRVEVDTPLIDHPLPGSVFVATPHDNPFGSLLAIYIAVDDPQTGLIIKLPGHIEADPSTGQLTTTFDENPQLPFEDFKLDFFGGARGALRTPPTCGNFQSASALTPWSAPESGPPAQGTSPFQITQAPAAAGGNCPATPAQLPSAPKFVAGTETPTAGHYSPFILHLHREDGSQELTAINTTLPPGLVGKLAGVAECSDAAIAAAKAKSGSEEQQSPSCPASSQLGTVNVASGAGPAPYWVTGHAYLAGPYKGAPLSLAIITPATAGPYDLGTVVVRVALYVNPETAQISAKSDPIPTILEGIPLDVRTIDVKLDRPQFSLNPTDCEKMSVTGEAVSVLGLNSSLSDPFQVGGCNTLRFQPKLALSLNGRLTRAGTPALKATLTMKPGEANIAVAQVTLPASEQIDNAHLRNVCTRVQFAANQCPPDSVIGYAKAQTPLLDNPLEGPVYLMTGFGHTLPDLFADLGGQIRVDLNGKVDRGKGGGLRSTFEVVPDAPVSKFTLSMSGGKKGLLENNENLCLRAHRATAQFTGQNGALSLSEPLLHVKCPKAKNHRKRHRPARAG